MADVNAPHEHRSIAPQLASDEAEQAVLGALMLDPGTAWPGVLAAGLTAPQFYRDDHRLAFAVARALRVDGRDTDPLSVHEAAKGSVSLAYLHELTQSVVSGAAARAHAEIVVRLAACRAAADELTGFQRWAAAAPSSGSDYAGRFQDLLQRLHGHAAAMVPRAADAWPTGSIEGAFERSPSPRRWLARGRLIAGRAQLLVGTGGSSKTKLIYHLAIGAVLRRLPWSWEIETTGSAALFLAEDTREDVAHALHDLGRDLPADDRARLVDGLRVYPLAGMHALLLELDGQALRLTQAYDWLMRQIEAMPQPVAFIGLDPALGLTEGDEMNPAHQRRLGELADRIAIESGACVVLTAHAAKSIHGADELGSHSARGSGAITDAVRAEFTLRTMTADEARRYGIRDVADRKAHVQLAATKGNHLPPEAYVPVWLRRGAGGLLSEVELQEGEQPAIGARELRALELLRTLPDGSLRAWQALCSAEGLIRSGTDAAQEKSMQRLRVSLQDAGLVVPGGVRGSWVAI